MKKVLVKSVRWLFKSVIGECLSAKVIIFIHKASDVNLLKLGYQSVGILNYKTMEVSGEKNAIKNIIKPYLNQSEDSSVIFDVGGNTGGYFSVVKPFFPNAKIYSFEPNPNSFKKLIELNPTSFNIALGSETGELLMYRPSDDLTSSHFTSNKEFVAYSDDIEEVKVEQSTLTEITRKLSMNKIDFLKIDTEGHDLFVLKGADKKLLENISFIQFEINESVLENRILLKDFYDVLPNFKLFRLLPNGLLNINPYNKYNEIFRFQNLLAINNRIDANLYKKLVR